MSPSPPSTIDVQGVRDLAEVPFEGDDTKPNGSSFAFLFECGDKRILSAASNGGSYGHPHPETMARIATAPTPRPRPRPLCFN
jgi:hypothetical protein